MTFPPQMDGFDAYHGDYDASGHFPWAWSRSQGHRLAGFKATEGTGGQDPTLVYNRQVTADLGFRWRIPFTFILPGDIAAQIGHLHDVLGDLGQGEALQLDCESAPPNYPRKLTPDEMHTARDLADQAWPGKGIVYGGEFYNGWQNGPLKTTPWWLPWYGHSFDEIASQVPWTPVIHQWGGGKEGMLVPGLVSPQTGRADSNTVLQPDLLDIICGYIAVPTTPPITEEDMPPRLIRFKGTWDELLLVNGTVLHGSNELAPEWRLLYGVNADPALAVSHSALISGGKQAEVIDPAGQDAFKKSTLFKLGLADGDLARAGNDGSI